MRRIALEPHYSLVTEHKCGRLIISVQTEESLLLASTAFTAVNQNFCFFFTVFSMNALKWVYLYEGIFMRFEHRSVYDSFLPNKV